MKYLATARNYMAQLYVAGLWEEKVHQLAAKYGIRMVHDEIIFDDEAKATAFRVELEHWWESIRGGRNVGTQVSAMQGTTEEGRPREAGDL